MRIRSGVVYALLWVGTAAADSAAQPVQLAEVPLTGPAVTGAAAIHEHVMAEHAFSGKWHWGSVDGPESHALGQCDGGHLGPLKTHAWAQGICDGASIVFNVLNGNKLGRDTCCHTGGVGDCAFKATHGNDPDPGDADRDYLDWPIWDTTAHPRYWHGHLRQALQAGLKLMVVHAVESQILCTLTDQGVDLHPRGEGYRCEHGDSFTSLRRQIVELKQFVGRHSDFMQIAYSPAQARQIILAGKMAVVIGVEAEYTWGNERTRTDLEVRLGQYHSLGVRTAYLAHHLNTRLAGAAQFVDSLWANQSLSNCFFNNRNCRTPNPAAESHPGHPFEVEEAFPCLGFGADYYHLCALTIAERGLSPVKWDGFRDYPGGGVRSEAERHHYGSLVQVRKNLLGLTAEGHQVVRQMMERGMLVEIGHLSDAAIDDVFRISQEKHNYPLISSHTLPRALLEPNQPSVDGANYVSGAMEFALSDRTLFRVRATDGIAGVFAGPNPASLYAASHVANNCVRSTRSLAQIMAYTADSGVKVAWAGDWMGQAKGVAPRRGYTKRSADWCGGDSDDQAQQGPRLEHRLDPGSSQAARDEAYFGTRGLGHWGLLGAFHDDLRLIGLREDVLDRFTEQAAESFIRTWEKSEYVARYRLQFTVTPARVFEGNSGVRELRFVVTRGGARLDPITVGFASADGPEPSGARAGEDYEATAGSVQFLPGEASRTVVVPVVGDRVIEADETLRLRLFEPETGTTYAEAAGTIRDDDAVPTLSIADASAQEGTGLARSVALTVSLSHPVEHEVSVAFATANSTAMAGSDYSPKAGTVVFAPGALSRPVNVTILGDAIPEDFEEVFLVNLSSPVGAGLSGAQAVVTIVDDDFEEPDCLGARGINPQRVCELPR
jgi:microsomal dipeptidase-like Zn-dependent dipeptidase